VNGVNGNRANSSVKPESAHSRMRVRLKRVARPSVALGICYVRNHSLSRSGGQLGQSLAEQALANAVDLSVPRLTLRPTPLFFSIDEKYQKETYVPLSHQLITRRHRGILCSSVRVRLSSFRLSPWSHMTWAPLPCRWGGRPWSHLDRRRR
jgi:hypothetical protein